VDKIATGGIAKDETATDEIILQTRDLSVQFGGLKAVNRVNLTVTRGDLLGLIGPNGAGKTTIFNLITGSLVPTEGEIIFRGHQIGGKRPDVIARMGISRTFQNIRLFPQMSVLENVAIGLHAAPKYTVLEALFRLPRAVRSDREVNRKAMEHLERVGLAEYHDAKAGSLPYGLQRKLEIARAMATSPQLLLLDEPAAGMNNEECQSFIAFLRQLHRETGLSIVLIEHHMNVVMDLCPRIYVLNLGEVLAEGDPREIQRNPAVIRAYLGERRRTARAGDRA